MANCKGVLRETKAREGYSAVLVRLPLNDQSHKEKRPAVVSSSGYSTSRRDIVIMAITSQVRTPLGFGEVMVAEWQGAGLVKASVLKPAFTTIAQGLVLRIMGHPSAADIEMREVVGDLIE